MPITGRPGGLKVCRMHGAADGAPKGNRNALKHGATTAEALGFRREIATRNAFERGAARARSASHQDRGSSSAKSLLERNPRE